jgi:hypothetical protein
VRPLDRLFGAFDYPLDVLLPSACWLALSAAVLAGAAVLARRHDSAWTPRALRIGLWAGAADAALWLGMVGARALHGGALPPWLAAPEALLSAARSALDTALWYAVGVGGAVQPDQLFRGYSSWTGPWTVLMAALFNEVALVTLAVTGAVGIAASRVDSRRRKYGR